MERLAGFADCFFCAVDEPAGIVISASVNRRGCAHIISVKRPHSDEALAEFVCLRGVHLRTGLAIEAFYFFGGESAVVDADFVNGAGEVFGERGSTNL